MNKDLSYVIRGNLRKEVLLGLVTPCTPTILAKRLKTDRPSVSRAILFLCEKRILRCVNPKDKRGRLYVMTDKGRAITKDIGVMEGHD